MLALLLGVALALGALWFVIQPLFQPPVSGAPPRGHKGPRGAAAAGEEAAGPDYDSGSGAIDALREIEFDRATGKLSDADYVALKERYTAQALAHLRASRPVNVSGEGVAAGANEAPFAGSDDAEAMIARFRAKPTACAACGPRPESNAVFCSNCGRFLGGNCFRCGAQVTEPGARFCSACGASLAA